MLFQVGRELVDGHPIDTRTTLIGLHPLQCFYQVFSLAYLLHQSVCAGWAFGHINRPGRFDLFPSYSAGFTRWPGRKVHFHLDVLSRVVPEIHVLFASPIARTFSHRSRLSLSVDSAFRL